jgi:hypothetical protein
VIALAFTGAWTEVIGCLSILGGIGALYKHIQCQQEGCYRLGRFAHGHLHLCSRHHPHVPDDGKINEKHITEMTLRKANVSQK